MNLEINVLIVKKIIGECVSGKIDNSIMDKGHYKGQSVLYNDCGNDKNDDKGH
jgi:hypothetical protein